MWSVEYIASSNLWGVYYNGILQSTSEDEQEARELVDLLNSQAQAKEESEDESIRR